MKSFFKAVVTLYLIMGMIAFAAYLPKYYESVERNEQARIEMEKKQQEFWIEYNKTKAYVESMNQR